ncbi:MULTISPECIES: phage holin family protein [Glutamicibacter]|uniref:Membrane protein n=1 Tax=Glutamicibacter nicotianae TaxID=37929 RepID=A0ABQ0RKX6_GLUNI|nr:MULTISPECIES: phage holin family protein [Glutamicibacter]MDV2978026.1 phage holin family protein [Actinomycetes bacterium ARC8]QEP08311.1 phage holin family protein [Glutamicibacter sp. ZJUTW]WIV43536.1 phage holin family protein [Glutamicibacter nicotianae]GEC12471.1 membrane protein [Glutamicibacter nicotianae]
MSFLIRVIVNALALAAAVWVVPGLKIVAAGEGTMSTVIAYLVVAVIFGLVNALVRPIVKLFSLPITCLTLGLFTIVINALMLLLTSWLTTFTPIELVIEQFWWDAIAGTIIISIVSAVLGLFVKSDRD